MAVSVAKAKEEEYVAPFCINKECIVQDPNKMLL